MRFLPRIPHRSGLSGSMRLLGTHEFTPRDDPDTHVALANWPVVLDLASPGKTPVINRHEQIGHPHTVSPTLVGEIASVFGDDFNHPRQFG